MAKPTIWAGPIPQRCDLCKIPFLDKHFVDARTIYGPWGNLCLVCHGEYGVGLGTGRGQKYKIEGNVATKVEG